MLVAKISHIVKKRLPGKNHPHVTHDRFHDQARNILLFLHDLPHCIDVVEVGHQRVLRQVIGYPLAVRHSIGGQT